MAWADRVLHSGGVTLITWTFVLPVLLLIISLLALTLLDPGDEASSFDKTMFNLSLILAAWLCILFGKILGEQLEAVHPLSALF